jgi:hypothetical protein
MGGNVQKPAKPVNNPFFCVETAGLNVNLPPLKLKKPHSQSN